MINQRKNAMIIEKKMIKVHYCLNDRQRIIIKRKIIIINTQLIINS